VQFFRDDCFTSPEMAAPRRFFATTGLSVAQDGKNESEDLGLSAKNALLNMIDHPETRGFTRQQAYAPCNVAVDLRIGQAVDVRDLLMSALPSLRGVEEFGS
jgi:formamidase